MKICCIGFDSIHIKKYIDWLIKRGHQVYWLTHQRNSEIKGVQVVDIGFKISVGNRLKRCLTFDLNNNFCRHLRLFLKIRKIIKDIKPDILHLHTLYFPSYAGVFAGFRPMIITPWNGDILWTKPRPFYYKKFVRYALKKADAITSDNQIMAETSIKYGVAEDKILVTLWYGVDTKLFKPMQKDNRLLEELNIKDGLVVLSMRSLEKGYNIDKIIKSIPLVLRKYKDVTYIFAWYGCGLENEMRSLVKDLQIENKVRFVGRIPYEVIPKYYSISDVAISIASPDSTPATMLESMASGVPMVVSREAAITEFIKDGVNGKVIDPHNINQIAEKTVELLLDGEKRKEYGRYNLGLVEEIGNIDVEMNKVEDIYKDLIAKFSR